MPPAKNVDNFYRTYFAPSIGQRSPAATCPGAAARRVRGGTLLAPPSPPTVGPGLRPACGVLRALDRLMGVLAPRGAVPVQDEGRVFLTEVTDGPGIGGRGGGHRLEGAVGLVAGAKHYQATAAMSDRPVSLT